MHKLLCHEFPKFSTPPDAAARRAILFPDDGQGPKFVWVPTGISEVEDEYDTPGESVNFDNYIGANSLLREQDITINMFRGRNLQNTVSIFYRDTFLVDGSRANSGIAIATKGLMGHDWRGSILVMKQLGNSYNSRGFLNIDTVDFRDAVDYFLAYPSRWRDMSDPSATHLTPGTPAPDVLGVRINCNGDRDHGGRPMFEAISLPGNHAVFSRPVCEISALVGFPIQLIPFATQRDRLPDEFNHSNQAATWIQMGADPDSPDWGQTSPVWHLSLGSAIVVRADRKKLWPEHVDALCYFCQYVLHPLFVDSMSRGVHPDSPISKQIVRDRMTPREFENFYLGYNNSKFESSFKWDRATPYPF